MRSPFSKKRLLPNFLRKTTTTTTATIAESANSATTMTDTTTPKTPRGTARKSIGGLPVFTITYCHFDDPPENSKNNNSKNVNPKKSSSSSSSSLQEYTSVESCVKSIFPECQILAHPVQRIPMRISITATLGEGTTTTTATNTSSNTNDSSSSSYYKIWQGQQQHLSRTDIPTRTMTMREITTKLEDFRYKIGMT